MRLQDKIAVITGAASGIGLVVAQSFADAGAQVFISDLSADALADALAANPALRGTVCDVSDTSAIRDMFNAASAELGVVDVLINNAGVAGPIGPIEDLSIAAVESTFAINNVAQFSCAQEAVKLMPASGGASGSQCGARCHHAQGRFHSEVLSRS